MMVQAQEEMGEGSANPTDPYHTPTIIQPSTSQPQNKQKHRKPKRKGTEVPQPSGPTNNVANEAVYEEMDDSLERVATTATSLDAKQDRGNINKTQSKTTPNEPSSLGTSSGGVNTPRNDEDSLKLKELMELCTNLQNRVINLEKTKTSQAQEIISLKRRVKRLEKKGGSRTHRLKRLYKVGLSRRVEFSEDEGLGEEDASKQGRIDDIDANEDIYLVNLHRDEDIDEDMFGVNDLEGDKVIVETKVDHEVVVKTKVASKDVNLSVDEVTLAQTLATLKSENPKADKVMLQEPEHGTITTTTAATTVTGASTRPKAKGLVIHKEEQATTPIVSSQQPSQLNVQDKGKGKMVELEPVKKLSKKDQLMLDEELAFKLQAEEEDEERLAREKAQQIKEANIVSWDNVQAMIDIDYQMAQQMQADEQEKLTMRAQEKMNKPPTEAQNRNTMFTYLKNMAGYKHNQLKNKSFDDIQKLFDKAIKRVNTFVDMDTELVEGSEQKVHKDKETAELQRLIEIVPDKEEVAIDAIPLATKPPSIVDYKIHKEGKKTYYQIIRADGSSKMYLVFSHMLKSFDREDLETLWKLVKAKHGSTRPEEGYERVLWGDLKTMFDPHVEDQVWRNQQDYRVLDWKIYDSCGVHSLRMQHMHIHMLVEKRYPLTPATITDMLNKKLQCDHFSKMGRIVGIKRLHDDLEVTAAKVCVTAAK
ncbi:hypothetical protein Tco_0747620 [Tanacetum coccineum]|uniref:Uncharacterized protein n=1 Tax=Tanacetum coccineum TaxID=301880 RepID=A0ABQ4YT87_9ASTR